jgi:sugar phosphate isomerase/epimerase
VTQFAISQWTPDISAEAIESLQEQGVCALEPGPSFLFDHDEGTIREAATRYRSAGICLYSCHAPFGGDNDLSLLEEEKRQKALEKHVTALKRAALAGVSCLVIHPSGGLGKPEERPQRREQLYRSLETLIEAARAAWVQLALENMLPGHVGCESTVIQRIVEHFDSPFLGVCFDTGHAHLNPEGVDAAFANLKERTITFHLQDNDGNRDVHLQPPYGTIPWASFARAFNAQDFLHPAAVEAGPWNGASWGTLLREIGALFSEGVVTLALGAQEVEVICTRCGRYGFGTPERWSCGCE